MHYINQIDHHIEAYDNEQSIMGQSSSSKTLTPSENNSEEEDKKSFFKQETSMENDIKDHKINDEDNKYDKTTAVLAKSFFFDASEFDISAEAKRTLRRDAPVIVKIEEKEKIIGGKKSTKSKFSDSEQFKSLNNLTKNSLIDKIIKQEKNESLKDLEIENLKNQIEDQWEMENEKINKQITNSQNKLKSLNLQVKHKTMKLQELEVDIQAKKCESREMIHCNNSEEHADRMSEIHNLKLQLKNLISSYRKDQIQLKKTINQNNLENLDKKKSVGIKRTLSNNNNNDTSKNKKAKKIQEELFSDQETDSIEKPKIKKRTKNLSREEYLSEKNELFAATKTDDISESNPFFIETLPDSCGFLDQPETFLHFTDILMEQDRVFAPGEYAHVDVIISPLWPSLKEKFIIFNNADMKGVNGFTLDSLREIYDILQLNNLIFFNEKLKKINYLLFQFYEKLIERKKSSKCNPKLINFFQRLILKWNKLVTEQDFFTKSQMLKNARDLYKAKKLPLYFMKNITNYIYGRIILPDAKKLTKYEGFSDKTYGELMSDFLTLAFDKCGMNSESTFVDLGSGIGNTNFFASLSYNVKSSFGCEIMKNPSELCGLYHNYFIKMLQLYGISNHTVLEFELEKSFMDNEVVNEKLKSCSILLLNNFIFSPSINIEATKLVKYLPSGSKIIHLKPLQTLEKQNTLRRRKEHINYNENSVQFKTMIENNNNNNKNSNNNSKGNQKKSHGDSDNDDNKIYGAIKDLDGNQRILITTKYQMPSGDMVSWTTNNDQYNYFVTEVI